MKKIILAALFVCAFASPVSASAAGLTSSQIQAVLGLLQAFGADSATLSAAEAAMRGSASKPATSEPVKDPVVFRLKSQLDGLFDMQDRQVLASYNITANERDLDGKSFRATVSFTPDTASSTQVTYKCPTIKKGETAACEIRAKFSAPGDITYTIKRVTIGPKGSGKDYYDTDVLEEKIKAR